MSFKYKLIFAFILIIVTSSLPLSIFSLKQQETEKLTGIINKNRILSEILVKSSMNILMMNGGDLKSSIVDSREMMSFLAPLLEAEMMYADTILISHNRKRNGIVLASITEKMSLIPEVLKKKKLSHGEVDRLKNIKNGYSEISIPGVNGKLLEFVSIGSLHGKNPVAIGRIILSKSKLLEPIARIKKLIYSATVFAIVVVSIVGYLFSLLISQPIKKLTNGMRTIESGDFDIEININSKDEFGILSRIFNEMIRIINLKIYELETTNKKLSQIDKIKDQFLANTSHELRTPIHGIIGIADSLIDGAAGEVNESVT
jgi:methyl-accepting chemotaxis protein